jgi:hypothetical protein
MARSFLLCDMATWRWVLVGGSCESREIEGNGGLIVRILWDFVTCRGRMSSWLEGNLFDQEAFVLVGKNWSDPELVAEHRKSFGISMKRKTEIIYDYFIAQ